MADAGREPETGTKNATNEPIFSDPVAKAEVADARRTKRRNENATNEPIFSSDQVRRRRPSPVAATQNVTDEPIFTESATTAGGPDCQARDTLGNAKRDERTHFLKRPGPQTSTVTRRGNAKCDERTHFHRIGHKSRRSRLPGTRHTRQRKRDERTHFLKQTLQQTSTIADHGNRNVTNEPIFTRAVEKSAVFHRVLRKEPSANSAFLA